MQDSPSRKIAYWMVTITAALLFAVPGTALVAKVPHFSIEMARLGYPPYFLALFGALKVIGAVIILAPRLPRLKEWAYAGMIFDATFAAFSRAAIGDGFFATIVPLAIGALILASWALRPGDRKLPSMCRANCEMHDQFLVVPLEAGGCASLHKVSVASFARPSPACELRLGPADTTFD